MVLRVGTIQQLPRMAGKAMTVPASLICILGTNRGLFSVPVHATMVESGSLRLSSRLGVCVALMMSALV